MMRFLGFIGLVLAMAAFFVLVVAISPFSAEFGLGALWVTCVWMVAEGLRAP